MKQTEGKVNQGVDRKNYKKYERQLYARINRHKAKRVLLISTPNNLEDVEDDDGDAYCNSDFGDKE